MEIDDCELIELELKYCERCGGLWLRLRGGRDVYCAGCALEMADLPIAHGRRRGPLLPANDKVEIKAQLLELGAVCGEGGNA